MEAFLHHLWAQLRVGRGLPEGTRSPLGLNSSSVSVTTADQVPTTAWHLLLRNKVTRPHDGKRDSSPDYTVYELLRHRRKTHGSPVSHTIINPVSGAEALIGRPPSNEHEFTRCKAVEQGKAVVRITLQRRALRMQHHEKV